MIEAGLLEEVCDIYHPNADYTRGLRQAIGVREFEKCFAEYFSNTGSGYQCLQKNDHSRNAEASISSSVNKVEKELKPNFSEIFGSDGNLKIMLDEAIDKMKANTRKLIRRQIRRLNRLREDFGWDMHYIDATEAFLSSSGNSWLVKVAGPCVDVVKGFLFEEVVPLIGEKPSDVIPNQSSSPRDLWAQYICEACDNQILRGTHEWEQHKHGRRHKKRALRQKKRLNSSLYNQQQHQSSEV